MNTRLEELPDTDRVRFAIAIPQFVADSAFDLAEQLEQMERLAAQVLPRVF